MRKTLSGMRWLWWPAAGSGLGVDGAVGPAQPTAVERFARVLRRDGLVRLSRCAVEVENELVRGGQAPVPFARQAGTLIPHIPAKASPGRVSHQFHRYLLVGHVATPHDPPSVIDHHAGQDQLMFTMLASILATRMVPLILELQENGRSRLIGPVSILLGVKIRPIAGPPSFGAAQWTGFRRVASAGWLPQTG